MIGDVWRELGLNVKWYQWWGKNQHHLRDLQSKWSISEKHLIRSCSYKGNIEDVITMPGLKYDSGSTLGVLLILGCLSQIRGLAHPAQVKIVTFLRRLMSHAKWPAGLSLLPDLVLPVEDGQVSLAPFLDLLRGNGKQSMKSRFGGMKLVLVIGFV